MRRDFGKPVQNVGRYADIDEEEIKKLAAIAMAAPLYARSCSLLL